MHRRSHLIALLLIAIAAAPAAAELPDAFEQYAVLMSGDKKIGYVHGTRTRDGDTVLTETTMVLRMGRGPTAIEVTTITQERETIDGAPLSLKSVTTAGPLHREIVGVIADGRLDYTATLGDQTKQGSLEWPDDALLAEGQRLAILALDFEPGATCEFQNFNDDSLSFMRQTITMGSPEQVDLLGRVVTLYRAEQVDRLGQATLESVAHCDADAMLMESTLTGGLGGMPMRIVACDEAFALSDLDSLNVMEIFLVECPTDLSYPDLQQPVAYRIRLPDDLELFADDAQTSRRQDDGTILLTVASVEAPADALIPCLDDDPDLRQALQASRFVNADDPDIIAAARSGIVDAFTAAEAAAILEDHVAAYIETKDLSVGYATASEVFASRQGDCTEHAVLLAAMCRAVGIPTQVISGIAYVEAFGDSGPCFLGHAWVRCYIGDRWVHYDAALEGHDAGHIALATGDESSSFLDTMEVLTTMEIIEAHLLKP